MEQIETKKITIHKFDLSDFDKSSSNSALNSMLRDGWYVSNILPVTEEGKPMALLFLTKEGKKALDPTWYCTIILVLIFLVKLYEVFN